MANQTPKIHLAKKNPSTRAWVAYCGRGKSLNYNVGDVTCKRCIVMYANANSMEGMLEDRIRDVLQTTAQKNFNAAIDGLSAAKREIRTTSSTGGEKGVKLAKFNLIPQGPLWELAEHFGKGANKYAEHQWRQGYEWSKSFDAISRHNNEFWSGKDYDVCSNNPEGCQHVDKDGNPFDSGVPDTCYNHTGSHHMVAVAWHSFVLLEFRNTHPEHDDRYKVDPLAGFDLDRNAVAIPGNNLLYGGGA